MSKGLRKGALEAIYNPSKVTAPTVGAREYLYINSVNLIP